MSDDPIPDGWCFYTADFSCRAHDATAMGSVTLVRDKAGCAAWYALSDEQRETTGLYVYGIGHTIDGAIAAASRYAAGLGPLPA